VEAFVTCRKSQNVNGIMSSTNPISLENLFKIRPVRKDKNPSANGKYVLYPDIQLFTGTKALPYLV
jgi:hypothetical protein